MRKVGIVIAVVLFLMCGGVGWGAYQLLDAGREFAAAGVNKQQFDAQKEGAPEAQVRAALPKPLTDMRDKDLYEGDPGRKGMPAGASCVYNSIKPIGEGANDLYRFCFVGGKLAEKSALPIPE